MLCSPRYLARTGGSGTCTWGCCGDRPTHRTARSREKRQWRREAGL